MIREVKPPNSEGGESSGEGQNLGNMKQSRLLKNFGSSG
jgi:hypothetical protein